MTIHWQLKSFQQLSTIELYQIMKLRVDTFIVEQNCCYAELDNKDQLEQTLHLFHQQNNEIAAYLRLMPNMPQSPNKVIIGRVIVNKSYRQQGLGHQLMKEALQQCQQLFPQQALILSAQAHLQNYYHQHGFHKHSEIYLEDGIPHVEMIKTVN